MIAVEGDVDSASDGFDDNARLFLPATSFDRFAVTREINDGLLAPRFAPSQKAWVLTGALASVNPAVPAQTLPDFIRYAKGQPGKVNFAATLEGWHRSPAAQAWINRAKQGTSTASKSNFDTFLAQNAGSSGAPVSDEQRAELFKAFLEWNKNQH